MPRRYKQGADGQPHPAFYGKLPEEFSKADTMRFMVETDLKLSGCVSADTLAALRAEGYDYKDGNLVPAGKEETMQEKVANTTPAAPLKLDVSVRVIEPVKNLMGFASVKFNDCFVVENLKIVQGSKGLFLGMPSQPDGKGGYRDMAYPVTKEFREQLNTAVLQAYVILKAATFETGHGFALGHNPGAPSPFVTWQFTEGENGHRDYYWGRYGTSQAWAQRDFDRRVDDYQQLYHAAVKHTELEPEGVYRYYSTQRPVDIGTYPKPPDNQPLSIVNYDDDRRRPVADGRLMAWGELTYAKPLTEKQMEDYELKPAPGNPDRVRPSITARLKEGTRGQEPPKEPGQKRSHKNHEER